MTLIPKSMATSPSPLNFIFLFFYFCSGLWCLCEGRSLNCSRHGQLLDFSGLGSLCRQNSKETKNYHPFIYLLKCIQAMKPGSKKWSLFAFAVTNSLIILIRKVFFTFLELHGLLCCSLFSSLCNSMWYFNFFFDICYFLQYSLINILLVLSFWSLCDSNCFFQFTLGLYSSLLI